MRRALPVRPPPLRGWRLVGGPGAVPRCTAIVPSLLLASHEFVNDARVDSAADALRPFQVRREAPPELSEVHLVAVAKACSAIDRETLADVPGAFLIRSLRFKLGEELPHHRRR
jgi:hypothetical protein